MRERWKLDLILVWGSQFLSLAAFSSAYTFMPFYFKEIHVPEERLNFYVALFASAGNFAYALAAPFWGAMADRFGRKLMLIRANIGGAILMPCIGFITSPDLLIGHRLLLGMLTGTVTAAQTLVLNTTPENKRTFALGALTSALFSGMMVGQFCGGDIVNLIGFRMTFALCGILLLTAGLLTLPVHEKFIPVQRAGSRRGKKRFDFGPVWYLLILFICMSIARDMDGPFVPLLVDEIVRDHTLALRWSGYVFGCCSAVAIVMGSVLGWIADRTKVLNVLLIITALAGLMRLPQIFAGSVGMLLLARCGMIAAACGIEPLLLSWLAGATPETDHGRFFGMAGLFKGLGWSIGSLLGGGIIMIFGNRIRAVFAAPLVLMLLMVPLIRYIAGKVPLPENGRKLRKKMQ